MGQALVAAGKGIVQVATLIAAAGIVMGMINMTGVGVKLSEFVIGASGASLFLALVLAMVVCLIQGMGLPTTAAYVLAASVVAPALIKLGTSELAAHLFVFYFAIISAITPPVCAAVYVAAAIARANWVRTGFIATKLGLAGFIAPYMFVYSPALLLQGPFWEVTWATITASVGVIGLAGGAMGYFLRRATLPERAALIGAVLLLIKPGLYTDALGIVVLVGVIILQRRRPADVEGVASHAIAARERFASYARQHSGDLARLVIFVRGDLDEALGVARVHGDLLGEELRRRLHADGERGELDDLGRRVVHELYAQQPLGLRVEHQR
jgi:TRAP-type uncharacterized transport system fused permease subunit